MTVKLNFDSDFTRFLDETESVHDPIQVITDTDVIKCSGVLLSQHSSILRETLKEDNELFLTGNSHVRDCLLILYGGLVRLTMDNFPDILKFMVIFDIPGARKQVLDWMSGNVWTLENVGNLIEGSFTCAKAYPGSSKSMKDEIYEPCRKFFKECLVSQIVANNDVERNEKLEQAMEGIVSGASDKKELFELLLHKDLLVTYLPWISKLMDLSTLKYFMDTLKSVELMNTMATCSKEHLNQMFETVEDFDITLKEYKLIGKLKFKVIEKNMTTKSLLQMKECGALFNCWKQLEDASDILLLPTAITKDTDQFGVLECILSWLTANKPQDDQVILQLLDKVRSNVTGSAHLRDFSIYYDTVRELLSALFKVNVPAIVMPNTGDPNMGIGYPGCTQYTYSHTMHPNVTFDQQVQGEIVLAFTLQQPQQRVHHSNPGYYSNPGTTPRPQEVTVSFSHDSIPRICMININNMNMRDDLKGAYIYATEITDDQNKARNIHVPLYTEPSVAYETIKTSLSRFKQQMQYSRSHSCSIPICFGFLIYNNVIGPTHDLHTSWNEEYEVYAHYG